MRCRYCGLWEKEFQQELMTKLLAGEVLSTEHINLLQYDEEEKICQGCVGYFVAINWIDPPKWWKGI